MTVESLCDEETGVRPKVDSKKDLACIDEGHTKKLCLDEDE